MKLPFRQSTRRFLLWGSGLSIAHGVVTFVLVGLLDWTDDVLFDSGIPRFLMDDRIHVVREFLLACLTLLHPLIWLIEQWLALRPSTPGWALLAGNALLYGFGTATIVRWLNRPPRFFSRFALPFCTRRTVALALLLAIGHVLLSAFVYFGGLLAMDESRRAWRASDNALQLLHPWLLDGGLGPYAAAGPLVIAIAVFDAFAWGFLAALIVAGLRRVFVHDRVSKR
ncbi:MAG: hypothetical protein WBC44_15095 [Planctomycetaceae bacterium]